MAEIVNLRAARKQKARRAAEKSAAVNRVSFGRTKEEREHTEMEKALAERNLSGHLRDRLNSDE